MRYLGGKFRSRKYIVPFLKAAHRPGQAYVEPFLGAAWMMVAMDIEGPRYGNDIHDGLIVLWQALVDGWVPPIDITQEEYLALRARKHEADRMVAYAGFRSFGGKYFGGLDRGREASNRRGTLEKAKMLEGVHLSCGSYSDMAIPPNSLIYCDPPYAGVTGYACTPTFEHDRFWAWAKSMAGSGHTVFVSEYSAPNDIHIQGVWSRKSQVCAGSSNKKRSIERLYRVYSSKEVK